MKMKKLDYCIVFMSAITLILIGVLGYKCVSLINELEEVRNDYSELCGKYDQAIIENLRCKYIEEGEK